MDSPVLAEPLPSDLSGRSGRPELMRAPHRHDDLELNLVAGEGELLYLFGGEPVAVGPGCVAAFWAAVPHQLVASTAADVHWVNVPFATFLGWGLPDSLVSRLLSGVPLVAGPSAALPTDPANFAQWARDLACGREEGRRIALLEIEARLRRLGLAELGEGAHEYTGGDRSLRQAIAMVRYVAEHFREPVTVAEVAAAAQLHPSYAMAQFRAVVRATVGDYLTRCRLAEARRLLVTTDLPVDAVAEAAGFGSVSRFYAAFTAACGKPPARFRREYRRR
ncbi:helix-turn-helix domain-containing protein [Actinacidiphila bryophytorum]|uniref:Helix-turn-helix domain-containing protein n=1 Tax=Actinacidiphila bryophytorum TaxID=1436133 RepID=A0A9W4GXX9_9ACTN|nr:helix-turn-helix domain-containing protein [Actinacidiphila bryophytorum]MBM9435308.1 helix-turn-helix domain-containing protein [Actinacidiphila bryophytorum]CAG7606625.1 Helix-turn-helix domain-containing protein [Actinacidiphila bryophytorum]